MARIARVALAAARARYFTSAALSAILLAGCGRLVTYSFEPSAQGITITFNRPIKVTKITLRQISIRCELKDSGYSWRTRALDETIILTPEEATPRSHITVHLPEVLAEGFVKDNPDASAQVGAFYTIFVEPVSEAQMSILLTETGPVGISRELAEQVVRLFDDKFTAEMPLPLPHDALTTASAN